MEISVKHKNDSFVLMIKSLGNGYYNVFEAREGKPTYEEFLEMNPQTSGINIQTYKITSIFESLVKSDKCKCEILSLETKEQK